MLPTPVNAALEHMFLYFPDSDLVATPSAFNLPFEEVHFPANDDTRLHGWYVPGAKGQPLVLFCHGNAGNISHRLDNLRLLHELGVSVFIFDYRGYGRSEGRASESGTYEDARGALAWLARKGWTPERMIYFGRSLGAAVALQLATEHPPAGLILESAFTSIREMGRQHYPLLWTLAGWALEARYDNTSKIGQLKAPLLVIHGSADRIVPVRMGQALFAAAPEPKTLFIIPTADHNDTYTKDELNYRKQWQAFVDEIVPERP